MACCLVVDRMAGTPEPSPMASSEATSPEPPPVTSGEATAPMSKTDPKPRTKPVLAPHATLVPAPRSTVLSLMPASMSMPMPVSEPANKSLAELLKRKKCYFISKQYFFYFDSDLTKSLPTEIISVRRMRTDGQKLIRQLNTPRSKLCK